MWLLTTFILTWADMVPKTIYNGGPWYYLTPSIFLEIFSPRVSLCPDSSGFFGTGSSSGNDFLASTSICNVLYPRNYQGSALGGYGRRLMFWRSWIESQLCILGGHFFTLFCCKSRNVCLGKTQKMKKRSGMAHFYWRSCNVLPMSIADRNDNIVGLRPKNFLSCCSCYS